MELRAAALFLGFFLDFLIGDPHWLYHPVRLIGSAISVLSRGIRSVLPETDRGERAGGILLILLIGAGCFCIPFFLLKLCYGWNRTAGFLLESLFCYQMIAAKALKDESMKVFAELKKGSLSGARREVSMIVGRDTQRLNETGVIKAAVETVAENTSDGVVAPLFYMALGGAPLMFLYKGINTMDSMVGYRNEKYLNFGRYPAKLDDLANFLPARISAWFMIAACFFTKKDVSMAKKIYIRDRRNHKSPNAAHTEAVTAGALHIQLAGNAWYFGRLYEKPSIGDDLRKPEPEDIQRANELMYGCSLLAAVVFGFILIMIGLNF
ncbi:adenosylcobinamide-phosphate synthase CbiB [Anaerostipes sp.]|uniref:adenosylcobinamide-phosphate synthase CbiB n=1 Tax=Anaerostipes sp. TaxID=1872530 RepID=UPI0025BF82B8|nr:adenosylcobinamide-phosphate synthase CbiB [Anaerostipes sp.]MBS7007387.1 cobalamin biosynthesis protein CobD [Anaerostipes sp.]